MTAPDPQQSVRRIPHPITQTCQQLRTTYLASFVGQADNKIRTLTTGTTDFDFSAIKEYSVAAAQQFYLKVKITPSWLLNLHDSARSTSALFQMMIRARGRHVVYEIDLSSIKYSWTVVGCLRWYGDSTRMRYMAGPLAWDDWYTALKASMVREMMGMNAIGAAGRLMTKRSGLLEGATKKVTAFERAWLEKHAGLVETRE